MKDPYNKCCLVCVKLRYHLDLDIHDPVQYRIDFQAIEWGKRRKRGASPVTQSLLRHAMDCSRFDAIHNAYDIHTLDGTWLSMAIMWRDMGLTNIIYVARYEMCIIWSHDERK